MASLKDLARRIKDSLVSKVNDNEGFFRQGNFNPVQGITQAISKAPVPFASSVPTQNGGNKATLSYGDVFKFGKEAILEPAVRMAPEGILSLKEFLSGGQKDAPVPINNPVSRFTMGDKPLTSWQSQTTKLGTKLQDFGVSPKVAPFLAVGGIAASKYLDLLPGVDDLIVKGIKKGITGKVDQFIVKKVAGEIEQRLLKEGIEKAVVKKQAEEEAMKLVEKRTAALSTGAGKKGLEKIATIKPLEQELGQQTERAIKLTPPSSPTKSGLKVANIASEGILPQTGKLNVKNLNLTDEGKQLVRDADIKPSTVIGHKETVNKAAELGARKQGFSQAQIEEIVAQQHAARQEVVTAVNELDRLKKAGASQLELLAQADKIDKATDVAKSGAKLGGTLLDAQKIMADEGSTPVQKIVAMIKEAGVPYDTFKNDLINVDFNDANQAVAFFRKYVPPTWREILTEIRYTNMLSSPLTHITNIATNFVQTGLVRPVQKTITGAMDWARSVITGNEQKYFASSGLDYAKGYFSALPEAWRKMVKEITGATTTLKPDFDPTKLPAFAGPGLKNTVGKLYTSPLRLLEASDQFFKTLVKGGEVRAGMTIEEAAKSADYQLFRQAFDPTGKLGQGGLLRLFDKWNNFIAGARRLPGGNWIVPFLQTPTNILKQGIEFSPLGVLTIPGAKEPMEQLSKAIIGTTVFTAATGLAANGLTTWAMPSHPKEKELFMAAGMQPYSIKIGDKWVSYSKIGPLAYPFAMAAAYHDATIRNPDAATTEQLGIALAGTLGFFADQSYVRSIGDFIGAIQNKGSFGGGFSLDSMNKQAANLAGQLVPYDAFMGWLTRLVDPVYRKPEGFVQQLQAGIPGQSQKLEAYTNLDGTPSQRDLPAINAVSPYKVSQEKPAYTDLYGAQKKNVINDAVQKRQEEELLKGGKSGEVKTSGNKVMFVDVDGKVQTVDLTPITPPIKTGNETLDKMGVAEYKAAITKQKKAVKALLDAGKLTQEEAVKLLDGLQANYDAADGDGKTKKTITQFIKPKTFKMPGITQTKGKFKTPETITYAKAPITRLSTPKTPKNIKIAQRATNKKTIKLKAYKNTLAGK